MKSCINICFFKRWTLLFFFFFANHIISIFVTRNDFIVNFIIRKIIKKSSFTFAISTTTRNLIFTTTIFFVFHLSISFKNEILFLIFFYNDLQFHLNFLLFRAWSRFIRIIKWINHLFFRDFNVIEKNDKKFFFFK